MVAKPFRWALASLAVLPAAALALGLGDVRLNSTLNAPLDADIELIGATPDEIARLKPHIAPRETFVSHGLDWPAFLSTVTLHAEHTADGRDIIKLRSTDPVTDPFVTLLVEVDWDRGRLVHEYTVLLDPPVYAPGPSQAAPVAPAVAQSATREGAIERPANAAAPAETPAATTPAAAPAASGGESATPAAAPAPSSEQSYQVQRGDSLSRLASKFAGASPADARRWMVATYQANPSAFQKNMNLLRSGAVLRMPEQSAIDAVAPADATAEVRRQYAAWHGAAAAGAAEGEQRGHVRLVTPTEGSASQATAGGGAPSAEVKSLQGRVQELQSQLDESRRLLELRNQQLADLQAKAAAAERAAKAAPAPAPQPEPARAAEAAPPPAAKPPVEAANPPPPAPAAAPEAEQAPPPAAEPPKVAAENPPTAVAKAPPKPVPHPAAPAAPEESIFDMIMDYWYVAVGVVVVLIALVLFRIVRSRRETGFDDSLGRLAAASAGAEALTRIREPTFTSTEPQVAPPREENFLVEESGVHERPRTDGIAAPAPAARHVSSDETISSETAINLDQGDPLAEADFHMAYGLYDQAADLVRIAIQREPERRDLKLKLLEVFFVWGNKEQFLQTARELASSRAQAMPGEWEKIVIMGKQLAPDDPLFAGGAAVSGAAAAGVDLDLEGGQSRVDFDILGEPVARDSGVDLDIGTAIGERDPTAEAAATQATDRNLALHDPDEDTADTINRAGTTGTTRQMTQQMTQQTAQMTTRMPRDLLDESSPESPTVEQPALQGHQPTIRQKVEAGLKKGGPSEHTTELAIDDLGLDLASLDTAEQPAMASADAPTLVAGLDEHSRRLMETAEQRMSNGSGDLKVSETGSYSFDADALDEAAGDGVGDPSATSRLKALKSGGTLDFDIGDAGHAPAATNGSGAVDLDVGTATVPDAAFTATQRLGSEDLALPDLEPVTMSEVGTKLDLARAYMDMGDPEGARNILEEVMHEGSVAQKQEAQRLIESLPG